MKTLYRQFMQQNLLKYRWNVIIKSVSIMKIDFKVSKSEYILENNICQLIIFQKSMCF